MPDVKSSSATATHEGAQQRPHPLRERYSTMEVVPGQQANRTETPMDHPPAYSSPTYGPAEPSSTGPPHHPYHQQPEIAPDHQTLHHPAYANDPISPQTTGPATYFKPQPDQHQHQHPMQEYKTSPPPQSPPHGPASPPPAHVHPHPTPVPTRGMHSSAANNPAGAAAQPIGLLTSAPAPVHCPSCGATAMTRPSVVTGNTTHAWAAALCLIVCLGCIPYCVAGTKDVEQKCGNCGVLLGTWHRSGRFEQHLYPQQQQMQMQVQQPQQQQQYEHGQYGAGGYGQQGPYPLHPGEYPQEYPQEGQGGVQMKGFA